MHELFRLEPGKTYAIMASRMGVSVGCFRSHVRNIYAKAGVGNAVELVAMAYRNGGYLY